MSGKLVIAIMVVLPALAAVLAQTPSQESGFPINETICRYENPANDCDKCCTDEGYGSGFVVPVSVATALDGTALDGSQCTCTGSLRINGQALLQRQQEYFFQRTTAPLNG